VTGGNGREAAICAAQWIKFTEALKLLRTQAGHATNQ